jgi:hypothetical protein
MSIIIFIMCLYVLFRMFLDAPTALDMIIVLFVALFLATYL